jgi:YD repeat-containing protein
MLTITDPRSITFLTNEYDAAGRVSRQIQGDGGVFTFDYTVSAGFITSTKVTDPRGNATTSRFNNSGYLVSQTDALGQTTTFDRQPGSNLLLVTTDPLGRITQFAYDANGNVTSITDPLNNTRTFTYEPTFNKVTSITDPLGQTTTFTYDEHGNLVSITDPEQNLKPSAERLKTTFTYNSAGQPLTTTDAL